MDPKREKTAADAGGRSRPFLRPVFWLLLLIGAIAVANLWLRWNTTIPACRFRNWTGIPCPLCGGTRSLAALSDLEFVTAVQFNPLAVAAVVLLGLWIILQLIDGWSGSRITRQSLSVIGRMRKTWILIGLLAANWVYLILRLK